MVGFGISTTPSPATNVNVSVALSACMLFGFPDTAKFKNPSLVFVTVISPVADDILIPAPAIKLVTPVLDMPEKAFL